MSKQNHVEKGDGMETVRNKMSRYLDIKGQKFGRLTAVSYSHTSNREAHWVCLCECGNNKTVSAHSLKKMNTQSCGCLIIDVGREKVKRFKNKGPISLRLPIGHSIRNEIIGSYKCHARRRNYSWKINDELAIKIIESNCHYCGIEPSKIRLTKKSKKHRLLRDDVYKYNGIDRMDNNKGYTNKNVTSCCDICNYAKRALPYAEFQSWLDRVANFHKPSENNVVPIVEVKKIS